MPLTSYLDVIPLADAKVYLRIDDTQSVTDSEITNMIKSALRFVEKQTNHIMYEREFIHPLDSCITIYDHPIQSITAPASADDYVRTDKATYSIFELSEATITIRVGYAELVDVPNELIDAAKVYMAALYYGQENNEKVIVPQLAMDLIDENRRFIL